MLEHFAGVVSILLVFVLQFGERYSVISVLTFIVMHRREMYTSNKMVLHFFSVYNDESTHL